MEELGKLREEIDQIDENLVALFKSRMELAGRVAGIKGKNNMAIQDPAREQQVVDRALKHAGAGLGGETELLMRAVMAITRGREKKLMFSASEPLLPPPSAPCEGEVMCAFQGVSGAWSDIALERLFPKAKKTACESFEDVFIAVREKQADYGVVAIENSQTGAIGETYDLLRKYGCYIVGRTWVDIRHCLLAKPGTGLNDIREVFSHPQGFQQCSKFLHGRAWDLTATRNTAVAAETVASLGTGRAAAIGSELAASVFGLSVIAPDIMNTAANSTSFVVIAKEPQYTENDDLISITFSTAHRAGALCEVLLSFSAFGINLMRIESRPSSPGKYRFFAELKGNILDQRIIAALNHTASSCEYFEVIGCYSTR